MNEAETMTVSNEIENVFDETKKVSIDNENKDTEEYLKMIGFDETKTVSNEIENEDTEVYRKKIVFNETKMVSYENENEDIVSEIVDEAKVSSIEIDQNETISKKLRTIASLTNEDKSTIASTNAIQEKSLS